MAHTHRLVYYTNLSLVTDAFFHVNTLGVAVNKKDKHQLSRVELLEKHHLKLPTQVNITCVSHLPGHWFKGFSRSSSFGITLWQQLAGSKRRKGSDWTNQLMYPDVTSQLNSTRIYRGVILTLGVSFGWKVVVGFCCICLSPSPANACSAPYYSVLWPEGKTQI